MKRKMNETTKSKKRNDRLPLVGLFIVELLALLLIFIIGTRNARSDSIYRMRDIVNYIGDQCILYDHSSYEESVKSLIRISEKTQTFRWLSLYGFDTVDEDLIKLFAEDQRMTGIILTNDETGENLFYCEDGRTADDWMPIIKNAASASSVQNKCYTDRIIEGGYCYDYATIERADHKGIVLCYFKQKASFATGTEISIRTLLSGYDFAINGTVVVTDGVNVIGSNDETLNGVSVFDCSLVQKARDIQNFGDLIYVQDDGIPYCAMRGKGRGYYIYVFYPMETAYVSRSRLMAYSVCLGIFLFVSVFLLQQRQEKKRRMQEARSMEIYNAELDRLANEAIKASEAKTDFLRKISHDIRTPINGICGMIDIASYYDDDPEKRKACYSKMKDASGYLLELISEVLDVSKLERGVFVLDNDPFRIDSVLNDIIDMMRYPAQMQNIELSYEYGSIRHRNLIGSAVTIKRVCVNIISNALKYNHSGGAVSVFFSEEGFEDGIAEFKFVCTDTGVGISREFQKHMFEPFAQEGGYRKASDGVGLGLAIVEKLIHLMNGRIEVSSAKNQGTTISATFKVKAADDIEDEAPALAVSDDVASESFSGTRVLLVEDNDLNMEIAEFFLNDTGADLITARNGREAVDVFLESPVGSIDAILMDLMMPVMDGITAAKEIRSSRRLDSDTVPIIAMTASVYGNDIKQAKVAGMNDYVTKPLDLNKLVDILAKYLPKKNGESDS